MLNSTNNSRKNNLKLAAYRYRRLGYSIIPVCSNKVSRVSWKRYQSKHAGNATHHSWWRRNDVAGIGIVTGMISHLAVLDFDNLQHYVDFKKNLPHLTETYQVKTRRGVHLYFRIASKLTTQTMKADGLDWLWEGRYVVAPPSIIQGVQYEIIQDRQPKMITPTELEQIEAFVSARQRNNVNTDNQVSQPMSEYDLLRYYNQISQHGRNNALFTTTRIARNIGYTQTQTENILLNTFTYDRKYDELLEDRHQEGTRTIASVYTRSPQEITYIPQTPTNTETLPNEIRERLCQLKQTAIVRIWEAIQHITPDTKYITEEELIQTLKGTIGQHSIRKALTSLSNGKSIFQRSQKLPKKLSKLCNLDNQSKSKKNKKGRKKYYYRIPTIRDFCRLLGIKPIFPSDEITLDDLKSARTTRLALHTGFIRRSPGKYPMRWLAKRLGVSIRTLLRYNNADPCIQAIPVYFDTPLSWKMIPWISDEPLGGTCFVDETGKQYPAIPQLARKLIKLGHQLLYRKRTVNYYCYSPKVDFDALYIRCKGFN